MPKTITVKGKGNVKATPDSIIISLGLEAQRKGYDETMELAAHQLEALQASLEKIGFEKKAIKTTSFNVSTVYDDVRGKNGDYKRVFDGYSCNHRLKVEFDMDTKRLAQTLYAIQTCVAAPELSIAFTVKDPSAVSGELLKAATINAREKAEILCEASQVALGSLVSIEYNWGELNVVSRTEYRLEEKCMAMGAMADMQIEPDDISVSDTATFVWEME